MTSLLNILLLVFLSFFAYSSTKEIKVTIDDTKVIATVSESFHGVAFDASLFSTKGLWSFVDIT